MASFSYTSKDARGRDRSGVIEGKNKKEAKEKLLRMKMTSVHLKMTGDGEIEPIFGHFIFKDVNGDIQFHVGTKGPQVKDLIIFTKQFSTMLNSGVPLIQALGILSKQQASKEFGRILTKIQRSVENGQTLSVALSSYGDVFDKLYVAMVSAGEVSGKLDSILVKLVSYIEKSEKIRNQIKSALTYPVLVMFIAVFVVAGLMVFVVPTFASQYTESGRELPGLTQAVIDISNLFTQWWYVFLGSLIGCVVLFRMWIHTERGRAQFDLLILKAPVIGLLLKKIAVGRFCSTMSSMLSSGVNLLEALSICAASSGNKTIESFVLNVRKALEKGAKFSEPLAEGGLFPDMVISMVVVGETTGALDDMLVKVSDFYEEEVDLAVQTMLSMIEPIMIVVIGGIVAFIVVAMYLPVFDMAGGVEG